MGEKRLKMFRITLNLILTVLVLELAWELGAAAAWLLNAFSDLAVITGVILLILTAISGTSVIWFIWRSTWVKYVGL